jgi:hypothetical protein
MDVALLALNYWASSRQGGKGEKFKRIEQGPQPQRLGVEPQPVIDHPLGSLVGAEAERILGCRP